MWSACRWGSFNYIQCSKTFVNSGGGWSRRLQASSDLLFSLDHKRRHPAWHMIYNSFAQVGLLWSLNKMETIPEEFFSLDKGPYQNCDSA